MLCIMAGPWWHHRCAEYSESSSCRCQWTSESDCPRPPVGDGDRAWELKVVAAQCSNVPSCIPPRLAPARCPVPITPSSQVATQVSTQTSAIASCFHWDQAWAWPWHSNAWQVAVPQFPCVFKMPVKSAKQPMITAKRLWFHRSLRCGQLDLVTPARHLDSLVPGDEQCP